MGKKIKMEIKKHIGILSENGNYEKQLNFISWNGQLPSLDIRTWKTGGEVPQPLKGVTLTEAEADKLLELLEGIAKSK